jgi:hypothetical protein
MPDDSPYAGTAILARAPAIPCDNPPLAVIDTLCEFIDLRAFLMLLREVGTRMGLVNVAGQSCLQASLVLALASLAGCSSGDGADAGGAARPPAHAGDVWEVQDADDRAAVPGAIVAFVNGVHVMVMDGDRVHAGMTRLVARDGEDGVRSIAFPSGLTADLVPTAKGFDLRFSTGESVPVTKQADEGG